MADVAPAAPPPVAQSPDAKPAEPAGQTLPPSGTVPGKVPKPTKQATPGGAAPAEGEGKPKEEDTFEVVVKGEKRQYTREQALRKLARDEAADVSYREAKELTRKNQELIAALKDPARFEEVAAKLGHNLDELSQKRLQKAVEHAQLSEEQKELLTERQKRESLEAELKRFKETEAKSKQEKEDEAVFARFEKSFLTAAEKHGLEGTPANLERMVEIAAEAHDLGIPLTEEQVVAELREREDAAFSKLEARVTKGLKGEALAKRLGPAVVEEVLRWSVEKLRGSPPAKPAAPRAEPTEKAKNPYMTEAEFRKKHGI